MNKHTIVSEAFGKLYGKINNPNSACPDVEIGRVFDEMVNCLQEYIETSDASDIESWIMSYCSLSDAAGQSINRFGLELSYSGQTVKREDSFDFVDGKYKMRSNKVLKKQYATYDAAVMKATKAVGKTINKLISDGKLIEVKSELKGELKLVK